MARIVRAASAKADVLVIAEYIAADKPSAARHWVEELDKTLRRLARNPLMGEKVDHLAPGMRRQCYGNYLLFYVPIKGGIELRRVLHGARKIEDLF
ncbi:MAG: type II toxin-antitoxin system RelE/ParE family toxin [Planctomycetes bacterium]|nr:type II toxin-antitoxin system RelE/ParE family toxin [Planctomycetota bacterium]